MMPPMVELVPDPAGIARRLTQLRESKGLSRHKLAWDLDVTDSALGHWERGHGVPSTYAVMKYAEYFGVTTDWILFGGSTDADNGPKHGKWILDRSGAYCCSECMEPCAGYVMMKPRDKYCKMCGAKMER